MPNIRFRELYCYYGKGKNEHLVISEMNETFPDKKISVIMGPSGCGKTTLLKAILGIVEYDGDIYFDDVDIYDVPVSQRKMAYINQDVSLFPHMTIFDNIAFPLKNKKVERDELFARVREIAERLDIAHCLNVKPKYLSLGQQQRALLAKELVARPEVVLLDEPLSHLDAFSKKESLSLIKELNKEFRQTLIYVTHSYEEAVAVGDYIYVMDAGKFVLKGKTSAIMASDNKFLGLLKEGDRYEEKS